MTPVPRRDLPTLVVALFALWTLFVWGGRLRNLVLEPGGLGDANRWSLAGSLAFSALALALVAALGTGRLVRPAVGALGALTVAVWAVRAVDIALGDHSAGFIAVHLLLAAVSGALAAAAWRAVTRGVAPSDGGADRQGGSRAGQAPVG